MTRGTYRNVEEDDRVVFVERFFWRKFAKRFGGVLCALLVLGVSGFSGTFSGATGGGGATAAAATVNKWFRFSD